MSRVLSVLGLNQRSSHALMLVAASAAVLYCLRFYWQYAEQAWFFQDDFSFIAGYEHDVQPMQWLSAENFGRFLSRNVYWWGLLNIFGRDAHAFYLFNLVLMLATAALLVAFVWPVSRWVAGLAGLAYFGAGATVSNFAWLSNSQHLLAHFFVAFFLLSIRMVWARQSAVGLLACASLFILALSSNVLSVVALSFPLLLLWCHPRGRFSMAMWGVLAVLACSAISLFWVLRPAQEGHYATSLAWPVLSRNMGFYFGHWSVLLSLAGWLFAAGLKRLARREPLQAWVLMAGPAFIVPFLPLVHQHYANYAALSHVFTLVGVSVLACVVSEGRTKLCSAILFVVLALVFARSTAAQIKSLRHEQRGANEQALVQTMFRWHQEHALGSDGSLLCFSQQGEHHVPGTPFPSYWWGLAFGEAFKTFVSDRYRYELSAIDKHCRAQIWVHGAAMRLVSR